MKIIHLSDPHISPDKLFEHDSKSNLKGILGIEFNPLDSIDY